MPAPRVIRPPVVRILPLLLCAGGFIAAVGCGQRSSLPVPPPPPPIPTDQWIWDAVWSGYGDVSSMLLTRQSFSPVLVLVRDSARVEAYFPGSPSSEAELRPNAAVSFLPDSLVRPVHVAEGPDGSLYVADLRTGPKQFGKGEGERAGACPQVGPDAAAAIDASAQEIGVVAVVHVSLARSPANGLQ